MGMISLTVGAVGFSNIQGYVVLRSKCERD